MADFLNKHKFKLIAAATVVILLVSAWAWGGNYSEPPSMTRVTPPVTSQSPDEKMAAATEKAEKTQSPEKTVKPEKAESTEKAAEAALKPSEAPEPSAEVTKAQETAQTPPPTQNIDPNTNQDKYKTDPVPDGQPIPVEPQDVTISSSSGTCTLTVRCETILDNMDELDSEKVELIPENGLIFPTTTVTFYEGESVFNVLQREMRRAGIHMEFVNTPIYNSAYIEGINNLYEFDCGRWSGWMYKVNEWFPNYGCSRYQIKQGDVIEWVYTCDLGRDIGGSNAIG